MYPRDYCSGHLAPDGPEYAPLPGCQPRNISDIRPACIRNPDHNRTSAVPAEDTYFINRHHTMATGICPAPLGHGTKAPCGGLQDELIDANGHETLRDAQLRIQRERSSRYSDTAPLMNGSRRTSYLRPSYQLFSGPYGRNLPSLSAAAANMPNETRLFQGVPGHSHSGSAGFRASTAGNAMAETGIRHPVTTTISVR